MKEEEFILSLIKEGCIGFFEEPIKLSSGQDSSWYINLRLLQNDFDKLDNFAKSVVDYLSENGLDKPLIGVPESATLPAIKVNEKLGKESFILLRQQLKSHGVLGKFPYSVSPTDISGKAFNLFEDTGTTGDSAITAALHLYEGGARVEDIIIACYREDRRWGGMLPHEYIRQHLGVPVYYMSRATTILPLAIKELHPSGRVIESLKKEYAGHSEISRLLNQI